MPGWYSPVATDGMGGGRAATAGAALGFEEAAMRRRRWLSRVLPAGAALAALLLLGVVQTGARADASWQELRHWVAAEQAAYAARSWQRPVLWGEGAGGDAFAAYAEALAVAAAQRRDQKDLIPLLHTPAKVTAERRAELLAAWAPAVAALQRGARCAAARPPADPRDGFAAHTQNLLDARWVVNVAMLQARDRLAVGDGHGAVTLMLDAATFGADHLRSPLLIDQMIGVAMVAIATTEVWTDERLRALGPQDLRLLGEGLQRLDAQLPVILPYDGELLFLGSHFARWIDSGSPASLDGWALPSAWRYGFSTRWMLADAFLVQRGMARAIRDADAGWIGRRALWAELAARAASSSNPVVQQTMPNLEAAERNLREVVTQVRLLRLAVAFQRGEALPELADPLGEGPLTAQRSADDAEVVLQSQGRRPRGPLERRARRG